MIMKLKRWKSQSINRVIELINCPNHKSKIEFSICARSGWHIPTACNTFNGAKCVHSIELISKLSKRCQCSHCWLGSFESGWPLHQHRPPHIDTKACTMYIDVWKCTVCCKYNQMSSDPPKSKQQNRQKKQQQHALRSSLNECERIDEKSGTLIRNSLYKPHTTQQSSIFWKRHLRQAEAFRAGSRSFSTNKLNKYIFLVPRRTISSDFLFRVVSNWKKIEK